MRKSKPRIRSWREAAETTTIPAVVIFVITPLILIVIGALIVLPEPRYRVLAFRSFLVLTLCLLPATMWYLFIATRKASLLNDFVTSLNRLGLLQAQEYEDKDGPARRRRVYAYLQKFEAIYGPLSPTVRRNILDGRFSPDAPEEAPASASDKPSDVISATTTVPILLATVLTGLGWLITLPPSDPGSEPLKIVEEPLTYAFLGAYFFSLQMLFRRYVRKDLRGSAYVAAAMRIILAVIGTGVAVEAVRFLHPTVTPRALLVVGFTIGVFPKVAWQIVQTAFRQVTGLVIPSLRTESPLTDLDGLTVWHETRLEEEDIENVPNMATTDIVELLLNTRMPPNRLIDWVDQAILYTHLTQGGTGKAKGSGQADADRRRGLRRLGIRTATSFVELPVRDQDTAETLQAEQIEPSSLLFLQEAVKTDANFALVRRWRCLSASASAATRAGGTIRAVAGNAGPGTEPIVAVPSTPA